MNASVPPDHASTLGKRFGTILLALAALTVGDRDPAMATSVEVTKPQPPMPAPRDPEIAVREEYDAALAAGTVAALDLFIRRYPDHPLAEPARREMERLQAEGLPP